MTVCVAVLCSEGFAAIGASDRMLSTADNRTKMMKVHHLTDEIIVMISGDVALHSELLIEIRALIAANADTPEVITVKNICDSYVSAFQQAKHRRSERKFLLPLGLDSKRFISRDHGLSEQLTRELTQEMLYFAMPDCSAIFMGVDSSSGYLRAHLYSFDQGHMTCNDDTGFASIGVGVYQAASSLMFSGHSVSNLFDRSLYLTYAAKKRAEVAPGVGVDTDMVYVSRTEPKYSLVSSHVIQQLDAIHLAAEEEHQRVNAAAEGKCHEYLETLREVPVEQRPEPDIELSGSPPHSELSSSSPQESEAEPV